jgi:hypothetical protein
MRHNALDLLATGTAEVAVIGDYTPGPRGFALIE